MQKPMYQKDPSDPTELDILIAQIKAKDHKIWITLLEIALEKVFSEQEKILNN